jgi:hypothetical protein
MGDQLHHMHTAAKATLERASTARYCHWCQYMHICMQAGVFQLANLLRENTIGSIAISVLFAIAAATHWQAGQHLPAVLGERISQAAIAAVYFIAGEAG